MSIAISLEDRRRRLGIVLGRALAIVEADPGGEQLLAILVDENQDRLRRVPDLPLDEAGLIVVDERDDVATGDVAMVDDGETGAAQIQMSVRDLAGGNRGPERAGVQEAGKGEIVDVLRLAGDLRHAFLAEHIAAHGAPLRHARDYMHEPRLRCVAAAAQALFFCRRPSRVLEEPHDGHFIRIETSAPDGAPAREPDRPAAQVGFENGRVHVALPAHRLRVAQTGGHDGDRLDDVALGGGRAS